MNGNIGTNRPAILSQLSTIELFVRDAGPRRFPSHREVASIQRELRYIRTTERRMRHDRFGNLSNRDQSTLQFRIDRLDTRLRINAR